MDDEAHDTAVRRRNQTACEACRVTKIRCQPSDQPGVCRKCLESKRECVSRTGPRTRRPRRQKAATDGTPQQAAPSAPAPNAPSSTFSIDFAVPARPEVDDNFDTLRETHEHMIDTLLPEEEEGEDQNYTSAFGPSSTAFPTPPASTSTPSHSIESLHGKPQFNLSSAEGLLTSFRSMLSYFPCIVLSEDDTVPHLAATRPFVLLAILSTASGSRTLQGNSLYDEEFRKVLGLKFVAGGERSLELLQGMLVYCAWYPFHLRPKNRQIYHYIRMAGDLIQDMELDQEPAGGLGLGCEPTIQQLDGMRAYLAFCYYVAQFVMGWRKYKNLSTGFTPWTRTCCDILEANSTLDADHVLVTLVRLANLASDASDAVHDQRQRSEQESRTLLLGIETQSRRLRERIPSHIAAVEPVRFSLLFNDIQPNAAGLFAVLRPRETSSSSSPHLPPTLPQLISLLPSLKLYLSSTLSLSHASFISFTAVDWGRLILAIVLAFRLSLPLAECPSFDHVAARADLRLEEFLEGMSAETDLTSATSKVDVLSASRVVMRVVKRKFKRRVEIDNAKMDMREAELRKVGGCPMLDGSLDEYFPLWDAGLGSTGMTPVPVESMGVSVGPTHGEAQRQKPPASQPVFHDLWATMTMSWAGEDEA